MGSSCFSRGGNKIIDNLLKYIQQNELSLKVKVKGCLCNNECSKGPNVVINQKNYDHVDPTTVIDLLKYHLEK